MEGSTRNWGRLLRRVRARNAILFAAQYYDTILKSCSKHVEDLYDKRIIRRYCYNDTVKLIRAANEELTRLYTTPAHDLLRRGTVGVLRPLIRLVDRAVFSVGLPTFMDLVDFLGCPQVPREHIAWLQHVAIPCLVSRESGKCPRLFFRSVSVTNPNSYTDGQCVWASVPMTNHRHIAVKLVIGRDPLGLIRHGFRTRLRILDKRTRSLLWALHPRYIVTSGASEIRLRIQGLIKIRERISKTPIGKLIREFLTADTNHRVSLFCAMCIPRAATSAGYGSSRPRSRSDTPPAQNDTADSFTNLRNYAEIHNPFETKDRIPRSPPLQVEYRPSAETRRGASDEDSSSTQSTSDIDDYFEELSTYEDGGGPDEDIAPLISTMYDLIANHGVINRRDVADAIDLLPWEVQKMIRQIRDHIMEPASVKEDEIPNESRLQMLPLDNATKHVVLSRIKEANARGGDSSTKAAAWVNGFFRIPFGVYRKEPVLQRREKTLTAIQDQLGEPVEGFHDIIWILLRRHPVLLVSRDDHRGIFWSDTTLQDAIRSIPDTSSIRDLARDLGIPIEREGDRRSLISTLRNHFRSQNTPDATDVYAHITSRGGIFPQNEVCEQIGQVLNRWYSHRAKLSEALQETRSVLNHCVRFQEHAKDHVMRVIGQWMVGRDTGYCLGFEGPPGVGKTTLAREGLAKILRDEDGKPRPFRMIALGTATTGSTLVGHNYTYQSSQWGDIVRILMECECMNPIIYVDELDKVSQTENGREIISILTHLTDPAQNEEFQDRYFAGVRLDMSRVLFVFSYNDPSKIDPILLDRIHRIRFDPLTTHEKVQVIRKHTLPEIASDLRMPISNGAPGEFLIADDVIREVIHRYTNEAGLRKIREILYDTFREVNLATINAGNHDCNDTEDGVNQNITLEYIEEYVLHGRHHSNPTIMDGGGVVSHTRVYGMFATQSGTGGVLPIRVSEDYGVKDPEVFPVRVTGSLGSVMKESVEIARTVCLWLHRQLRLPMPHIGLHVHFPEGATPKDGPSAGSAICLALFAFVRNLPIPGDVTITGEIDIDGAVLRVGGISEKLTGAKRAGAQRSLIPVDNTRDLSILRRRVPDTEIPNVVVPVNTIQCVLREVVGDRWEEIARGETNDL